MFVIKGKKNIQIIPINLTWREIIKTSLLVPATLFSCNALVGYSIMCLTSSYKLFLNHCTSQFCYSVYFKGAMIMNLVQLILCFIFSKFCNWYLLQRFEKETFIQLMVNGKGVSCLIQISLCFLLAHWKGEIVIVYYRWLGA